MSSVQPAGYQQITQFPERMDPRQQFSVLFAALELQDVDNKSIADISERLIRGQQVASALLNAQICSFPATKDAALDLTWFLMARAFQANEGVFYRGTVRLQLSKEESERFKAFYKAAGGYHRISSHFKGMTVGHQIGLDVGKGTLPLDPALSTLLCGCLSDGSFFIKLERESVSWKKPLASCRHLIQWIQHAFSGGEQVVGGQPTCRETDGIDETYRLFQNIHALWQRHHPTAANRIVVHRLLRRPTINALHHMIQHMNNVLDRDRNAYPDELVNAIATMHKIVSAIPFAHIACGREVILSDSELAPFLETSV